MNTRQAAPVLEAELSPEHRSQWRCCDLAVPLHGAQTPSGHLWDEGMSPAAGKWLAQQRGIKQRWQAWACPSKEPFEADKERIHVLFLAGCCGPGEAENRPVNSVGWRAARGGRPAGFHRTSGCHRSPACGLRRSSCCPATAALPAPHPCAAGRAAPCSALPNQLSPDGRK